MKIIDKIPLSFRIVLIFPVAVVLDIPYFFACLMEWISQGIINHYLDYSITKKIWKLWQDNKIRENND